MKTTRLLATLIALLSVWQGMFAENKEAYAYIDDNLLIFCYDTHMFEKEGGVFPVMEEPDENPEWDEEWAQWRHDYEGVTEVIFDPSFDDFRPKSTSYWFYGMQWIESFVGLEYLHTEAVTDMSYMFTDCDGLTSLDLTSFDVSNVTDMTYMFAYSEYHEMIYAGDWSTIECDSYYMFGSCFGLPGYNEEDTFDYDISWAKPKDDNGVGFFSTRRAYAVVEDNNLTFYYDGYNFENTYNIGQNADGTWRTASFTTVTFDASFADYKLSSTAGMFRGLTGLTTIYGLDNLNTSSITNMSNMFNGCTGLTTIYCAKDWSGLDVPSTGMFAGCTNLVGAISYDNTKTDITYANPVNGYFSILPQAYAVEEGSVLTFYYDNKIDEHSDAITYEIPWGGFEGPGWLRTENNPITRVVFDPSFADYDELESTSGMFYLMQNLTSIEGLEYLNTENVITMGSMFYGCSSLTSLNLSNFNTSKVQTMWSMFQDCSSLTSLDLTNFDMTNVYYVYYLFDGCSSLKTIFCNDDLSNNSYEYSNGIFGNCYSLVGGNGTKYIDVYEDAQNNPISYAHPDAQGNPGFFTALSSNDILLYDSRSNTETISNKHAERVNVYLADRILYKDGDWNTLCLPFNVNDGDDNDEVTFTGTPLEGAAVMTLAENGADFSDGELSLNFVTATTIEAGKPYIIKWEVPEEHDIVNPFFSGVTISQTNNTIENEYISFVGNYDPVSIGSGGDKTKLFLGARNKLYYPSDAMTINSFRAYFQLKDGLTAGEPVSTDDQEIKSFVLNFGEETGIEEISNPSNLSNLSNTYFTLDGRRLGSKPADAGLYIHNGRKVMIK